jgi:hypothetical protein
MSLLSVNVTRMSTFLHVKVGFFTGCSYLTCLISVRETPTNDQAEAELNEWSSVKRRLVDMIQHAADVCQTEGRFNHSANERSPRKYSQSGLSEYYNFLILEIHCGRQLRWLHS